jgi:ABC-type bacteriocin/lantibiotic exporter with double-glycine peptidase domain
MNRLAGKKALKMRELGNFIVDQAEEELLEQEPPAAFTELTDTILRIRTKFLMTKNIMQTINNLLIAMGPFGVIAYGGYLAIQGEIEVGVILAFVSGLERLGGPIRDLIGAIVQSQMRGCGRASCLAASRHMWMRTIQCPCHK